MKKFLLLPIDKRFIDLPLPQLSVVKFTEHVQTFGGECTKIMFYHFKTHHTDN